MSEESKAAMARGLAALTAKWRKAKRHEDKEHHLSQAHLERLRHDIERDKIKDAAYATMKKAYRLASANHTLPANARQIMYSSRPLVLERTGGKCWTKSSYFTQVLLPDYIREHPDETADWDVVYDDRGDFTEPHTGKRIGLGTLAVRDYVDSWENGVPVRDVPEIDLDARYPTSGPRHRYRFALFIEKQGFRPILEAAHIEERFDIGIMSTKGMSVTAARRLVEELTRQGVTILVAHDFDISGLGNLYTLGHDTRRYEFTIEPNLIDLGLRLADVKKMKLQSEPVTIKQKKNPCELLWDYGATDAERKFLVRERNYYGWNGQRVELNAMTSDQFIAWIERKLKENGVEKLVPEKKVLDAAWRRGRLFARVEAQVNKTIKEAVKQPPEAAPKRLAHQVREMLAKHPSLAWDDAIARLAKKPNRAA